MLFLAVGLAALALRLAVPAGFMPAMDGGFALTLCPDSSPAMAAPMTDADHGGGASGAQSSCAFADLSLPAIGSADPVQLAAALVFILLAALFLRAQMPALPARRLRPPLRAPPLPA